jgi:hypothetical protein
MKRINVKLVMALPLALALAGVLGKTGKFGSYGFSSGH